MTSYSKHEMLTLLRKLNPTNNYMQDCQLAASDIDPELWQNKEFIRLAFHHAADLIRYASDELKADEALVREGLDLFRSGFFSKAYIQCIDERFLDEASTHSGWGTASGGVSPSPTEIIPSPCPAHFKRASGSGRRRLLFSTVPRYPDGCEPK